MSAGIIRLLCLHCRTVTEAAPDHELMWCPTCLSTAVPADADDIATVTLTKHELRVLTMWASNWARSTSDKPGCEDSPAVIQGITDHLGQFTDAPLTLTQEMADVRQAFPDATVTVYRDGAQTDE